MYQESWTFPHVIAASLDLENILCFRFFVFAFSFSPYKETMQTNILILFSDIRLHCRLAYTFPRYQFTLQTSIILFPETRLHCRLAYTFPRYQITLQTSILLFPDTRLHCRLAYSSQISDYTAD